jgi:hypothetical protein
MPLVKSPWEGAIAGGTKLVGTVEVPETQLLIVDRSCLAYGLQPYVKALQNITAYSEAGWIIVTVYNDYRRWPSQGRLLEPDAAKSIADARQLLLALSGIVVAAYFCCDPEGASCWDVRQTPGFESVVTPYALGYEEMQPPFGFSAPDPGMIRTAVHQVQPDRVLLVGTDPEFARRAQVAFLDGTNWKD